jgi:flagellin-like hook-associated protein FlgL
VALNDISLSAGMRANLKSLLSITPLLDRTQSRLATGKKVNNALDNPTNFFASQAHTQRANDLSGRKDGMVEGVHSVNAADKGITAITSLIESANGLIQSARTSDTTGRVSLGMQFNTILSQIDQIADDSGYKGKNFLRGDSLNVLFNENGGSQLTIPTPTFEVTASALGISAATISTPAIVVTGISVGIGSESIVVGTHTAASASWVQNQNIGIGSESVVVGTHAATSTGWVQNNISVGIGSESIVVGNHSAYPASIQINDNLISASYYGDSMVLKSDGSVVAWGAGVSGVPPEALSGVVAVAAGGGVWGSTGAHALALKNDGTVVAWGDNTYGQVSGAVGLSGVLDIAVAGYFYSVVAKNDGSVLGWGGTSSSPVTVLAPAGAGFVAVAAGTSHVLGLTSNGTAVALNGGPVVPPEAMIGVVAIAAGGAGGGLSLALKNDGSVIAWGDNTHGQVIGASGLSGVVAIAASYGHALALKNDGTVVAWGDNGNGQVNVPLGLSGVVAIAAGGTYSLALKNDGSLVGWGNVSVPADALTGNMVPTYSDFKLSPNDVLTGLAVTGGQSVYVGGILAVTGTFTISGNIITLATPVGILAPVTYDYNDIIKATSFTLGTTLVTGQYISDVFINGSQIPTSGYSVSGVSIDFTSSYAPTSGQVVTASVFHPVFKLATNDVLTGMTVIPGGPTIYVSGVLASTGTYTISGDIITIVAPTGTVTYDYNSGYTSSSTSPVTTKTTAFTLGTTLTTGQYITDVFINGSQIPVSGYFFSGVSIDFTSSYAPTSGQIVTAGVYNPSAQSGAIGSYYSVFQLATNDVSSGMSVISGGPSVYVSGELAATGTYSITGNKITLATPVGQNTPVTYDYNSGYTSSSSSPVTIKATSFTLGTVLGAGQYIADLFINGSKIPASGYSISGTSINFVPGYAPTSGQVITASVYHPATRGSWQTESGLDLATDQLATAINTLRNHSAALASNMSTVTVREDFTNSMIQTLLKGADNLTLADMNEEGANMLMLKARQQLGTTSLQMASKAAQGVQRLFE